MTPAVFELQHLLLLRPANHRPLDECQQWRMTEGCDISTQVIDLTCSAFSAFRPDSCCCCSWSCSSLTSACLQCLQRAHTLDPWDADECARLHTDLLQQPLPQILHGVDRIRSYRCCTALSQGVTHHILDILCVRHGNTRRCSHSFGIQLSTVQQIRQRFQACEIFTRQEN